MDILEQIQQMLHSQKHYGYDPPDAVCMTLDRYDALVSTCTPYLTAEIPPGEKCKERIFGLQVFIDRHSPISYVAVGKARIFDEKLNKSANFH